MDIQPDKGTYGERQKEKERDRKRDNGSKK